MRPRDAQKGQADGGWHRPIRGEALVRPCWRRARSAGAVRVERDAIRRHPASPPRLHGEHRHGGDDHDLGASSGGHRPPLPRPPDARAGRTGDPQGADGAVGERRARRRRGGHRTASAGSGGGGEAWASRVGRLGDRRLPQPPRPAVEHVGHAGPDRQHPHRRRDRQHPRGVSERAKGSGLQPARPAVRRPVGSPGRRRSAPGTSARRRSGASAAPGASRGTDDAPRAACRRTASPRRTR